MLPYSCGIRTFQLHVVNNYLINYLALYARLMRSRTRVELASPVYLGLGIILIIIYVCMSDTFPDTRGTRIPRLLGVKNYLNNNLPRLLGVRNYLNNYFAMYTRLTCSHIRLQLASPPTWG